jgi:hypothetical protein
MNLFNLFPEHIAKEMDGRQLLTFAVLEKEGTKIYSQNDFIDAYHSWEIFSITRRELREYKRRRVPKYFIFWNGFSIGSGSYPSYTTAYAFSSNLFILNNVFASEFSIHQTLYKGHIYLQKDIPVFDQVDSIRYVLPDFFPDVQSRHKLYRIMLDPQKIVYVKPVS